MGRVAIVTGGTRGIGAAICKRLQRQGHIVIAKGQTLSDEQILGMNWLVAGVQGKLSH